MDKKSIRISPNGILSTGLERKITILSSHFGVNGTLAEDIHVILDQMQQTSSDRGAYFALVFRGFRK